MPERAIDFDKIKDPEERAWAMIWKVARELQGFNIPDKDNQTVIDEIGRLRQNGELTKLQEGVLDEMGLIASADYDGF